MRPAIDTRSLMFIASSEPEAVLDLERRPRADQTTGSLLRGPDLVILGAEHGPAVRPVRQAGGLNALCATQPLRVR